MVRTVGLGIALYVIWLLMSGHYQPLLLGLGALSSAAVVLIARRMDVVDHEGVPIHLGLRAFGYWFWLAKEVVKANIDVARRILAPSMPISPTVIKVATSQRSELGQVIYANSITLTPGTVSMLVRDNEITVHAISEDAAADLARGEMDRRVAAIEGHS